MKPIKEIRAYRVREHASLSVPVECTTMEDVSKIAERMRSLGCPAEIAQRAEQRAKKQIVDRDAAHIDADNRRRAAEIARQIANEKF